MFKALLLSHFSVTHNETENHVACFLLLMACMYVCIQKKELEVLMKMQLLLALALYLCRKMIRCVLAFYTYIKSNHAQDKYKETTAICI